MFVLDLFNTPYERALNEGAVDDLEARRIHGLNTKMLDLLDRAHGANPEMKATLKREYDKVKAERDSYFKVNTPQDECMGYGTLTGEGQVTPTATGIRHHAKPENYGGYEPEADPLARLDKHAVNRADKAMGVKFDREKKYQGGLDLDEAGIGQDLVNKTEKMARATPQTKTGAVASTVKNAAKWLAGQGGPGKEGPTYEGAGDIEDRGEYDQEGDMAKDNLHTIRREAEELERILSDNDNLPEWVQDKLANVKGMITAVSEYMQTQHERSHEEMSGQEGVTMAEWKKEGPWKQISKSKSGKPVDPRGEVTHLSDVARREAELKAQAQKKNSKEVDEAGGGWALDPRTRLELQKRKQRNKTIAKWAGRPVPPQDSKQKEINEDQRLSIGDPVIVTAPNEFEGKTGEIAELSPSGKFVIVDLYNHGKHSMHLSDIEYNQYADDQEEDDWYDDEVAEGWSDAIVAQRTGRPRTPYSVYIKGKKWKDFENDDHAEAVANKLRAKFKAEGRDPGVITIAPTDYDKDLKEFALGKGEEDPNDLTDEAFKDGQRLGYSLVDGATRAKGFEVSQYLDKYLVPFSYGWNAGRKMKIKQAQQDGVALTMKKDGSLARAEQGVAEGVPVNDLLGKVTKDANKLFKKAKAGELKSTGKDFTKGDHWTGPDKDDPSYTRNFGHGYPNTPDNRSHDRYVNKSLKKDVDEADETSWTANSAKFRQEEDMSWPVEVTLEPKDDINQGRGAQVKTMTVTGQSRDAAKKKLVDYFRKNGWAVTGIKFTGDLDEGSFAHDQLKGEINDLFKPVVLQIVKWARAEGMTAKDLAGTSSHFFLDALDPDTYDRTQHLPDNYFNKLMDKANAKAVEILKKKGVAESATAPIIVPKRRAKEKKPTKFHIPHKASDYVPPAVALARDEEQKKKGVAEGDDLGHLDAEVFGRIDKEKQRRADLKKNDPAAYAREMEKDKKNYGRGIMGALRRKYDQPLDEEGVAEGHADQQRKIFKKNGKPVGEVGIDRESSPGNGQWYMKCYAYNIDNSGYDSYEEAVAELKHCLKQGVAEMDEGDISQLEKAVADAPVEPIANMEESFESKIQLQGITDQKLLEAARKIDTFSRSYK